MNSSLRNKYIIYYSFGVFAVSVVGSSIEDSLHDVSFLNSFTDFHHYILPTILGIIGGFFGYFYWVRKSIQKTSLELLKESEYKYRMLFENMKDVVCILDNEGKFIDINSAGEELFEYSIDEILKMKVSDLVFRDDVLKSDEYFEKLDEEGFYNLYEGRIITKTGKIKWIQVNSREYIKNGEKIGSQDLVRDITSRKEVENLLIEKNQKLKELNDAKDRAFSIIAHDLKAPFSSILGFSNLLSTEYDNYSDEQKQEFLGILNSGIDTLHKLLENLLLWARSQSGSISFNLDSLNLYLQTKESIEVVNIIAKNKGIKLINSVPEAIKIKADKAMLSTILRNLTSNAVKFTPRGGIVDINARNTKDEYGNSSVEISVSDTGIGIPDEILINLFKVNSDIIQAGTDDEKGTGLGLIICNEFVEKHKGKIWVESEIQKGTTFFISIPD